MSRKRSGSPRPPAFLAAPLSTRYCAECRWLRAVQGGYWCRKRGLDLGDLVAGKEACHRFEARPLRSRRRQHGRRPRSPRPSRQPGGAGRPAGRAEPPHGLTAA